MADNQGASNPPSGDLAEWPDITYGKLSSTACIFCQEREEEYRIQYTGTSPEYFLVTKMHFMQI